MNDKSAMRNMPSNRDTLPERTPDEPDETIRKTSSHHTPSLPTGRLTRRGALIGAMGVGGILIAGYRIQGDPSPDPDDYAAILDGMAGEGSDYDPYIITDVEELQAIADEPDAFFELGTDIDAIETADWNDGAGFSPIEKFTGHLDGNGYEIAALWINRPEEDEVGLFATGLGVVENISFKGYDISGGNSTGGIFGGGREPMLREITATDSRVEGLDNVGGLVGSHDIGGHLRDCEWNGDVEGNDSVGGVVGAVSAGWLEDSISTGSVHGETMIGGLIGTQGFEHTIETCHADGDVTGSESVGGLVGDSGTECEVIDSSAAGEVIGEKNVGGLVGNSVDNSIQDSVASGAVVGTENVGGLAGTVFWNHSLTASHAEGDITGEKNLGGLIGSLVDGTVVESFAIGSVTGKQDIGGLVGYISDSSVSASYALGNVSGVESVGGLAGTVLDMGGVRESFAAGNVTGDTDPGGLVGRQSENNTVTESYWDVAATGQDVSAGGTGIGSLDEDSPSRDMLAGTATEHMNGFDFGDTWETVQNSYPILSAIDPARQIHLPRWQVDFGEGDEPPIPPLYYPNDGLWALGSMWDGVIENPSGWRQNAEGQLGDVTIADDQFTFDNPGNPSKVTVEFSVNEGGEPRDIHLVIFSMPGPFDMEEIDDQSYIKSVSGKFEEGEDGELSLQLP